MLAWDDVPLRSAVAGRDVDGGLDAALSLLQHSQAEVRWNLMVDLGVLDARGVSNSRHRSGWTTTPKNDGRLNASCCSHKEMVAGDLWCMAWIQGKRSRPKARGACWLKKQQRLVELLPELLQGQPVVSAALQQATPLGVMRWGASRPLNHPLASKSCSGAPPAPLGFCGDWIEGAGFGRAEGAIRSGVNLAEQLHADR